MKMDEREKSWYGEAKEEMTRLNANVVSRCF